MFKNCKLLSINGRFKVQAICNQERAEKEIVVVDRENDKKQRPEGVKSKADEEILADDRDEGSETDVAHDDGEESGSDSEGDSEGDGEGDSEGDSEDIGIDCPLYRTPKGEFARLVNCFLAVRSICDISPAICVLLVWAPQ